MEFSIIAPILVLLMAATFEIGRALQTVSAVSKLASQYANAWADCTDVPVGTCGPGSTGELKQYANVYSIANLAPYLASTTTTSPTTGVTLQMFQVTMNGTTPVQVWSDGIPVSNPTLTSTQISAAQKVLTSGQSGVIVTVSYTFQIAIFSNLLAGVIPLSSTAMTYTAVQLKA